MSTSPNAAHIDGPLTSFATAYENADFISPIPDVKVPDLGGEFKKRNRRDVSQIYNDRLGDRDKANTVGYTTTDATYSIKRRGLRAPVTRSQIINANTALSPEEIAVETVMQGVMLAKEKRHADLLHTNTSYAAANRIIEAVGWSDEDNSKPDETIQSALATIPSIPTGAKIIVTCGILCWNKLRKHKRILAMKGMNVGMVSRADLAQFFEIDEVRVSRLTYDTANAGQAASYGYVWGSTTFAISVVHKTTGANVQGFAVNFVPADGQHVRKYRNEEEGYGGTEYAQVEYGDDTQAIQDDMGAIITGC